MLLKAEFISDTSFLRFKIIFIFFPLLPRASFDRHLSAIRTHTRVRNGSY